MDREIQPFNVPGGDLEQGERQDDANHLMSTYSGLTDSILTTYQHTWWSLVVGAVLSLLVAWVSILSRLDQSTALVAVGLIVGCFLVSLIIVTILVRRRLNSLDRTYEKRLR